MADDKSNTLFMPHAVVSTEVHGLKLQAVDHFHHKRIELRPQQRVARAELVAERLFRVDEGMIALDAIPVKGQRQILDLLMPGDVVSLTSSQLFPTVSVRALTHTTVVVSDYMEEASWSNSHCRLLRRQLQSQLQRAQLQQLLVGYLDVEARVASFLFAFALRVGYDRNLRQCLPLPLSRDDMADYLALNRDTLSRVMMRFETLSLIERVNRHTIHVLNFEGLRHLSPVSSIIDGIFGHLGKNPIDGVIEHSGASGL